MVALLLKVKHPKNKGPATQDWFSNQFSEMMGYYTSIINHIMEKY